MAVAASSRIAFHVKLADNYMELIDRAITDELALAQNKWGVSLSEETIELVRKHSLNQLSMKVNFKFKTSWNFQQLITVKIKGLSKTTRGGKLLKDLTIPAQLSKLPDVELIVGRDGFEVESEPVDGKIAPAELPDFILNKIVTWAKTAVFYGVGSYKG